VAWTDVSAAIVTEYVEQMTAQPYASSSVARKVAAIKSFFHYLESQKAVTEDPTTEIDSPKVEKRLPKTLDAVDIENLLAAPTKGVGPKSLRDTALLHLLYATGMRVTELVSLRLDDLDLANLTLQCPGKDDHPRILPYDDSTRDILVQYLERGRPFLAKDDRVDALFLNHRGQQLTRQGLWLIIKAYAEEAELSGSVTPHTLRHSFAAHKLSDGTELQQVQQLLGHANISTTQIYRQISADETDS
jgi:integrase/recombinase XerD